MKQSLLLLFFVTALSYGMEKEEGLYLVVGSTRKSYTKNIFPARQLWKEEKADLTLKDAYSGKKTTSMDIEKSAICGARHIVGNALMYKFEENQIEAVYLERLPTLGVCETSQGRSVVDVGSNYLGKCIQNVAGAMKKGAKIEIEWHPYLLISSDELENIESVYNERQTKNDPFTAWIDVNVVLNGVKMSYSPLFNFDVLVPQPFFTCVKALSEKIKQLLFFYEKEGVGSTALLEKRLDQEIWLLKELFKPHCKVLLSKGPTARLEEFSEVIKKLAFITMKDPSKVGALISVEKDGVVYSGKLYDQSNFLAESFFNFIVCDASIEYNSPYVKEFMQNNGFENVTITRKKSLRNGRENVHIIEATKS